MSKREKAEETVSTGEKLSEVKPKKKKRSKKFFILYIAAFAFLVYSSVTIINQSIEIKEKKEQLQELNDQLKIVEIRNDYLEDIKNYSGDELDEYIENIAREDLDYVKNGERVFINISGD